MNSEKITKRKTEPDKKETNLFIWSSDYNLNIPEIDREHRKLFDIIDEFVKAVKSEMSKGYLSRIFDRLIEYTGEHFDHEESIFKEYNYPLIDKHKREHKRLTDKVLELNHNRNYIFPENVEEFLFSWLKNHIMEEDMKFADFLHRSKK